MLIMIALMAISVSAIAQDVVKNGTIYKKHPYITKIIQLNTLFPKGDTIGIAGYYADSVKFYDATEPAKPYNLTRAKAGWREIFADWDQITVTPVGYPDGLEYTSDPFTVQSWWSITAVNKKTQKKASFQEVIFDMFNKDGKIIVELSYYDTKSLMDAMK
jgi:hypothetical protein